MILIFSSVLWLHLTLMVYPWLLSMHGFVDWWTYKPFMACWNQQWCNIAGIKFIANWVLLFYWCHRIAKRIYIKIIVYKAWHFSTDSFLFVWCCCLYMFFYIYLSFFFRSKWNCWTFHRKCCRIFLNGRHISYNQGICLSYLSIVKPEDVYDLLETSSGFE